MRSLWLASAALCLTAGVAMAQTSSPAPAPTGAPNAAAASPAPGASPGNMAPSNSMSGSGSSMSSGSSASMGMSSNPPATTSATGGLTSGSSSTAATSPHYTGQNTVSQPTGQASSADQSGATAGGSMGMSAPSPKQTATSSIGSGSGMMHTASRSYGSMSLPENATPTAYLKIASKAIKQHDKMLADDALSHAETRMLDRAVPASSGATVDNSPDVTAIENARQALRSGDYQTAASDTRMAMHDRHGMGGEMNKSDMSGGSDMPPMATPSASGAGAMGGPAQ